MITLPSIRSQYSLNKINTNFKTLETYINTYLLERKNADGSITKSSLLELDIDANGHSLLNVGGLDLRGALNMNLHKIINLQDPTDDKDAVNFGTMKGYLSGTVDEAKKYAEQAENSADKAEDARVSAARDAILSGNNADSSERFANESEYWAGIAEKVSGRSAGIIGSVTLFNEPLNYSGTREGLLRLDGGEYLKSEYKDLYNLVESGKLTSVTETDWNSGKTNAYVKDIAGKSGFFRLPKLHNILLGAGQSDGSLNKLERPTLVRDEDEDLSVARLVPYVFWHRQTTNPDIGISLRGTWTLSNDEVQGDSLNTSISAGTAPTVEADVTPHGQGYLCIEGGKSSITGEELNWGKNDKVVWVATDPSVPTVGSWIQLKVSSVTSVQGRTGDVVLTSEDVDCYNKKAVDDKDSALSTRITNTQNSLNSLSLSVNDNSGEIGKNVSAIGVINNTTIPDLEAKVDSNKTSTDSRINTLDAQVSKLNGEKKDSVNASVVDCNTLTSPGVYEITLTSPASPPALNWPNICGAGVLTVEVTNTGKIIQTVSLRQVETGVISAVTGSTSRVFNVTWGLWSGRTFVSPNAQPAGRGNKGDVWIKY